MVNHRITTVACEGGCSRLFIDQFDGNSECVHLQFAPTHAHACILDAIYIHHIAYGQGTMVAVDLSTLTLTVRVITEIENFFSCFFTFLLGLEAAHRHVVWQVFADHGCILLAKGKHAEGIHGHQKHGDFGHNGSLLDGLDQTVFHRHGREELTLADSCKVRTTSDDEGAVCLVLGSEYAGFAVAQALANRGLQVLLGRIQCEHGHLRLLSVLR
jgi:hypothetical protein